MKLQIRSPRGRMRRFVGSAASAAAAGLLAVAMVPARSSAAGSGAAFVNLHGVGSWGMYQELVAWENELGTAEKPVFLTYTSHGSALGRQDFLAGSADFVLSALPFSAEELAGAKKKASDFISAPVQVSSLAFMVQRPVPYGLRVFTLVCNPDDPSTWPANVTDPAQCLVYEPYRGVIKVPNDNLAAMAFHYQTPVNGLPLLSWNHPQVLGAMGVPNFALSANNTAGPSPVMRSDPDEMSYFLQLFAKRGAPTVWSGVQANDPTVAWEPISERLARQISGSRDGVDQQSQQLLWGGDATGSISNYAAGVLAPVPASAKGALERAYPNAKVEFVYMQNGNGEWVAPTPQSISAGIAAGDGAPLYALDRKVPGAYPLSWVDSIYVPAKGLTVAQTEGLATVIRYLVTEGQKKAAPVGEGQLSAKLVRQALAAADQIVQSNCVGSDRRIVRSTDPGPVAPKSVARYNIGPMLHCEGLTTQSTSTTASIVPPVTTAPAQPPFPPASDPPVASPGPEPVIVPSVPPAPPPPRSTGKPPPRPTSTTVPYDLAVATALPLDPPSTTSGPDRLLTFLVGVALYVVFIRPVWRVAQRGRTT